MLDQNCSDSESDESNQKDKCNKKPRGIWGMISSAIDGFEAACRAIIGNAAVDGCLGCMDYAINKPNPII